MITGAGTTGEEPHEPPGQRNGTFVAIDGKNIPVVIIEGLAGWRLDTTQQERPIRDMLDQTFSGFELCDAIVHAEMASCVYDAFSKWKLRDLLEISNYLEIEGSDHMTLEAYLEIRKKVSNLAAELEIGENDLLQEKAVFLEELRSMGVDILKPVKQWFVEKFNSQGSNIAELLNLFFEVKDPFLPIPQEFRTYAQDLYEGSDIEEHLGDYADKDAIKGRIARLLMEVFYAADNDDEFHAWGCYQFTCQEIIGILKGSNSKIFIQDLFLLAKNRVIFPPQLYYILESITVEMESKYGRKFSYQEALGLYYSDGNKIYEDERFANLNYIVTAENRSIATARAIGAVQKAKDERTFILDVGCGPIEAAHRRAKLIGGREVVSVTIDRASVGELMSQRNRGLALELVNELKPGQGRNITTKNTTRTVLNTNHIQGEIPTVLTHELEGLKRKGEAVGKRVILDERATLLYCSPKDRLTALSYYERLLGLGDIIALSNGISGGLATDIVLKRTDYGFEILYSNINGPVSRPRLGQEEVDFYGMIQEIAARMDCPNEYLIQQVLISVIENVAGEGFLGKNQNGAFRFKGLYSKEGGKFIFDKRTDCFHEKIIDSYYRWLLSGQGDNPLGQESINESEIVSILRLIRRGDIFRIVNEIAAEFGINTSRQGIFYPAKAIKNLASHRNLASNL